MPTEMELYDFISNHKHDIDLDNVDIDSDGFKSLSLEKQHEIILNLKNASRTPNQARVQEMLANSKSARDFSTAQIKNLVHRAALTNRYHSTLKDDEAPAFARRVTGYRSKEFVLSKNHDITKGGWELKVRDNAQNVVADLSGLQGFKKSAKVIDLTGDITNVKETLKSKQDMVVDLTSDESDFAEKSNDYVYANDELSTEELWSQIQSFEKRGEKEEPSPIQTKNVVIAKESLLEKYLVSMKDDNSELDEFNSLNENILNSNSPFPKIDDDSLTDVEDPPVEIIPVPSMPENMDVLYPNLKDLQCKAMKSSVIELGNLIVKAERRLGKSSKDEDVECHKYFINLCQSIMEKKKLQNISFDSPETASEQEFELVSVTPRKSAVCSPQKITSDVTSFQKIDLIPQNTSDQVQNGEVIVITDSDEEEEDWEPVQLFPPANVAGLQLGPTSMEEDIDISPISNESSEAIESLESVNNIDVTEIENEEAHQYLQDLGDQVDSTRQIIIDLAARHRKGLRDMSEITNEMVSETQDLLKLFGIPFILSPMEAESQCAYLLMNKLVDGIVTDDSDVFLFGGSTIYRNMFNSKKYIECFTATSIKESLGLERCQLIQLAYLLGSDYSVGIKGLGPVKSVEIVTEWPSKDLSGLLEFKQWVSDLQQGNIGDFDTKVQKRLRNVCKKLVIPDSFPEEIIYDAYMDPRVDDSLEKFHWGEIEMRDIIDFLQRKLSWDSDKSKSILIPVIKEMHTKKSKQTSLDQFFQVSPRKHQSTRIQDAVKVLK